MLLAKAELLSLSLVFLVIGLLAEGLTRLTARMQELQPAIRKWTIVLAILSGVLYGLAYRPPANVSTPDPLLENIIAGGLAALLSAPVWYLGITLVTFLFLYVVVAPLRFVARPFRRDDRIERGKTSWGWFSASILGAILGFVIGIVRLGAAIHQSSHISGAEGLTLIGGHALTGAVIAVALKIGIRVFIAWRTASRINYEQRAYLRNRERETAEQVANEKRGRDLLHAEREAARNHLADFYAEHRELLAAVFPPALLQAFLACEMPDSLPPEQLWAICQGKIAEWQPIIVQERAKRKTADERMTRRNLQVRKIDAEIRAHQDKMSRLANSGLDAAFIEDETHGLLMKIRELEEQKELLLTLGDTVDA
jgi:hypothetical protein